MTCREALEFLMDYVDEGLPAAQRESFEQHLNVCPPCVRYIASYRDTVALGRKAFEDLDAEVPDDFPEQLARAILDARSR